LTKHAHSTLKLDKGGPWKGTDAAVAAISTEIDVVPSPWKTNLHVLSGQGIDHDGVPVVTDEGEETATAVGENTFIDVGEGTEAGQGEALPEVVRRPRWPGEESCIASCDAVLLHLCAVYAVVSEKNARPVKGAEALEEAVAGDDAAPRLASGGGAEEADGCADAHEDQLQEVVRDDVEDARRRARVSRARIGHPRTPPALLLCPPPAILPPHQDCKFFTGDEEIARS
jgi:hypothetical protein